MCASVSVCVCVYVCVCVHMCVFRVVKTIQNALSINSRGTLVVYNAPAYFTYQVPVYL